MSNKYQAQLDNRLIRFDSERQDDKNLQYHEKLNFLKAEIIFGELYPAVKVGITGDGIDFLIGLCIYIEAINRGFMTGEAFDETERQMMERKAKK